jgi:hypothetical protein
MRKRKYVVGALLGAAGAMALSGLASGAVVDQTVKVVAGPTKYDKKERTGTSTFRVDVDTTYDAPPNINFDPAANRTVLTFDGDFKFNPGNLPPCTTLTTADTSAAANAKCATSKVGQGSSVLRTQLGGTINAVVDAFNGAPEGGLPVIILHVDPAGVPTKPNLIGKLSGNTLDVTVPVTPGAVITHFDTSINKVKVGNKKKTVKTKSGKKKKKNVPQFYVMTRCSDGDWAHSETTTFVGGSTKSAATNQKCQKKKTKKKKKKKK